MSIIRSSYEPYNIRLGKQFVGKLRSYVFVFYPTRTSPKFGSPETTDKLQTSSSFNGVTILNEGVPYYRIY